MLTLDALHALVDVPAQSGIVPIPQEDLRALLAERDRYHVALGLIAGPPEDDSDALDILQEHWSIAQMALGHMAG